MTRSITISTPENVEVRFELAGIGSRFIAVLVDSLLQALIFIVLGLALIGFGFSMSEISTLPESFAIWMIAIVILVVFVITNGYFLYFEAAHNGQTPGKKSVGIKVVLDTGHPVDFRAALLRNLMRTVDQLPGMYGIGFISMLFNPDYRRLGDFVAGTIVVKVGLQPAPRPSAAKSIPIAEAPATNVSEGSSALLPLEAIPFLSTISKDDYRAVRHFLDRRSDLDRQVARDLSVKLAKPLAQKLHIELPEVDDPVIFLENVSREWERRMVH